MLSRADTMSRIVSPFAASTSSPGIGEIVLSLAPPANQVIQTFTYQYPLKLIAPDNHTTQDNKNVTIIFLLTYGGGLVGGDKINLTTTLDDGVRLALLTQGSTKIFKSPDKSTVTQQVLNVKVGKNASLCYLPDPTQPFAESMYEQKQTFYVEPDGSSNVLLLDWVSEGRQARGESWTLWSWKGRNEFREFDPESNGRLLLRDAVMIHEGDLGSSMGHKTNGMGILGTLIVYGALFKQLGNFITKEFADHPRIGAKHWINDATKPVQQSAEEQAKQARLASDATDGVIWTAAEVRGFVLVKFGANNLDGARRWLSDLLKRDGSVEKEFGHQALLCLR